MAKLGVVGCHLAAFRTGDHAPLPFSKLQYSTTQHHLVAIFQFVKLIAPQFAAARVIGAVQAAQIADKKIGAALDYLPMPARNALPTVGTPLPLDIVLVGH